MIEQAFHLARQKQSYLNILYLLASFPLGLLYFILLIVGISVGIGTLIIWVGIPILLLMLGTWWSIATFERLHTMRLLGIEIAPMGLLTTSHLSNWQRINAYITNPVTWKSLAYLVLKFLFGLLALIVLVSTLPLMLTFSLLSLALGLTLVPLLYGLYLLIGRPLKLGGFHVLLLAVFWLITLICSIVFSVLVLVYASPHWPPDAAEIAFIVLFLCFFVLAIIMGFLVFTFRTRALRTAPVSSRMTTRLQQWFVLSLTAYGVVLLPLHLFNGLTSIWGQFATAMLGMSSNAMRVAEAERVAALERDKAEKAEKSRQELIVNVSHELRTPIASIRGHIESLLLASEAEGHSPSPEALRNYLNIVYREASHLGTLVDDLLALARNDAQELSLDISAVDAAAIVEEVYQTLMPLARRQRQITLVRALSPGLPRVRADQRRLLQVLLNLVRNAITYTPDGGIVSISLSPVATGGVELQVADTGIGIAEDDLKRVFERFYRTDASRARTSGGFGLGLAIVQDFVLAMGGTIAVESKVGEGTCFHVFLSAMPQPQAVQETAFIS
jgi:two-component system phosphate regulon sensor histidine kinase PhoR